MGTQAQIHLEKINPAIASWPSAIHQLQRACACGNHSHGDGECAACKKNRHASLQRTASSLSPIYDAPPIVHEVLNSPGQPLDANTRSFFEPRFGYNFTKVRVHTDSRAAESARAVNARAYTVENDIVLGPGQNAPETRSGRWLLAHELAHVLQQRAGGGHGGHSKRLELSAPGDPLEVEADRVADSVLATGRAMVATRRATAGVQRLLEPSTVTSTPCPTSVRLRSVRQNPHNKERYRSYLGTIATMELRPGPNHSGHFMQEELTTVSNNCPAAMNLNHCVGHDPLPLNSPTTFLDGHVSKNENRSYLEGTGVRSCTVVCQQTYGCDSVFRPVSGVFQIRRDFQAENYTRSDGRTVHITTGTVTKTEVAQPPAPPTGLPPGPPVAPPVFQDLPERTLPAGEEIA